MVAFCFFPRENVEIILLYFLCEQFHIANEAFGLWQTNDC